MIRARLLRAGTFRLSLIFAGLYLLSGLALFAVITWRTTRFETARISAFIVTEADSIAQGSPEEVTWAVRTQFSHRPRGIYHNTILSALFAADGRLIAGNLGVVPGDLPADGEAHAIVRPVVSGAADDDAIIAVARRLPDGRLLVLGRGVGVLVSLEKIIAGALIFGAIPVIALALGTGFWISRRVQRRVRGVTQAIERVMQGAVHERLPVAGDADDLDQVSAGVNRMLAAIERLLGEVQGISNDIAHDLRNPLARVRTMLERGRNKAATTEEMGAILDRAIAGLDHAQSIITALLRIGEIESGRRRAGFQVVDLTAVAELAAELYAPLAEENRIGFTFAADDGASIPVFGDRELLTEAVVNLLDNAIKYTPSGGEVRLEVAVTAAGPVVRVVDNGPGIPAQERANVLTRFYRLEKSRGIKGNGLGLSIVLAIIELHGFGISLADARPGCVFEIRCRTPAGVALHPGARSTTVPGPAGRTGTLLEAGV